MSNYRDIFAANSIVLEVLTVATLPSSPKTGEVCLVSDADTTTLLATLVVYDGSAWQDMVDGTEAAGD